MNVCNSMILVFNHRWLLVTLSGLLLTCSQNVFSFSYRIICPVCASTTDMPDKTLTEIQGREDFECSICTFLIPKDQFMITYSYGSQVQDILPFQPAARELTLSPGERSRSGPVARPAATATTAIHSNLDTSVALANLLRPAATNQNLIFSPMAMSSLFTLLAVSAHQLHDQNLSTQTSRARAPDRRLAFESSGDSGYRHRSWYLASNAEAFSQDFLIPQFNHDLQNHVQNPTGLNNPSGINEEIGRYIQQGFPDGSSPASTLPSLSFSPDTRLAAVTVATFNQEWSDRFIHDSMIFTTRSEQGVQVQAMRSADPISVNYGRDASGWQVIILPYASGGDRMLLFLPPRHADSSTSLTSERIRQLISSTVRTTIHLIMPNLLISANHDLHTALRGSPLHWMVSPNSFSPNLISPQIHIASVESRQLITFESNERGSKAVAITQTEVNEAYIVQYAQHDIRIDRPFTALVINSAGMVCFHMEINNPNQ